MPTIKDIAKYTGVSPTTVSNVIHGRFSKVSPETKEKVEKALKELDYSSHMAGRLLGKHGSRIIGVIIQDESALIEQFYDNPYHGELIQALEFNIREIGYFMMFHRVSNFNEGARLVDMWDLEGVIVSGASNEDISRWQEKVKVPIVFLDSYAKEAQAPLLSVGLEDYEGAFKMTKHLIDYGHEQLMFIAKEENPANWEGVDAFRARGFLEAAKERGVQAELYGLISTYRHYQTAIKNLVAQEFNGCTALFFASDLLAVQSVSELNTLGIKVPEDISIVSFDGTPYSRYANPQISSVYQDVQEKASVAVTLLLNAIQSQEVFSKHYRIGTELVYGSSVKKIL